MNQTIDLTGEETAQVLVGALEYNGLAPSLVRVFGKARGVDGSPVIEIDLDHVEVTCAAKPIKVKNVPEDDQDPVTQFRALLESRRALLMSQLFGLDKAPEPPVTPGG